MTTGKSTDDELAWAVVRYLTLGPDSVPPIYLTPRDGGSVWLSGRRETLEAYAERFPRQMDKLKGRKGRKA